MQQKQKRIYEKCLMGIMGTAWISGLVIAGSDGPLMPWLNVGGLVLFFCASFCNISKNYGSNSKFFRTKRSHYDEHIMYERIIKTSRNSGGRQITAGGTASFDYSAVI